MTRFYPGAASDVNFPTIKITGGAHTETEIERVLKFIHIDSPSIAGWLIVEGILKNGDRREGVTIRNPHHNLNNALTNPIGAIGSSDQPDSRPDDLLRNPGRGAGATIDYYPWEWHQIGGGRPGAARDEILLHELVHAYMIQRGLSSIRNLQRARYARRLRRFDIVDDFFAIMITNVYSSECGRPIRRDHQGFQALNRNAMSIISDPRFGPLFNALAKGAPDLVKELRAIDTAFNPWHPKMDLIDAISVFDDP
jgi:hypothetical protein